MITLIGRSICTLHEQLLVFAASLQKQFDDAEMNNDVRQITSYDVTIEPNTLTVTESTVLLRPIEYNYADGATCERYT